MKKIMLLAALLVLLIAPASLAQNQRVQATLTVADSGSCGVAVPTSGSSLSLGLNSNSGATVIQASDPAGTFTGTIQFQRTADGTNWVTAPSTDATPVTSATAPGAWQVNVAGYQAVRACLSNQSAGSLTVVITSSVASAATHGGSGSGSGTVNAGSAHQPAFYPADGTAVSGTCTVPATNGQFPMLFNVTADAAVDPSCPQSGFVNTPITGAATTYTIKSADNLQGIEHDVAGSQSVTYSLPTPTTLENLQFAIPQICNYSTHTDTLTPVTWTINSSASVTIISNQCRSLSVDPFNATNWLAPITVGTGAPSGPAGGDLCSTSTYPNPTVCGVFGSPGPVGPVLNVLNYGASPSLADNATAFAAAATAFNAASLTAGNPTVKSSIGPAGTPAATCTSCTSLNPSFTIAPGDVVLVWPMNFLNGRTVTVTDSGGNTYFNQNTNVATGSSVQLWATSANGATSAATSITITQSGAASQLNVVIISFTNVGSYRFPAVPHATGTSTAPSISTTTLNANDIAVAAFAWYQSATVVTGVVNSGVLQQTFPSSNTVGGGALTTFTQATPGSTTNSMTLNNSAGWAAIDIELSSRSLARPIMYIPPGVYNYSSGLSLTQPGTIMCTPGSATLNYIGSAHAVDLGATLTNATLNAGPIGVDGCDFTGGAAMTEGLTFNTFNVLGFVRNATFRNFGTSTSHMVVGKCDNWDLEIGPQNRFFITDGIGRMVFINNQGVCDANSFTRFHDNILACWQGDNVTVGCTGSSGVGVILDGSQQKFYHNNMAFWSPDVRLTCTISSCFGNHVDDNILETASDISTSNVIQFGNTQNGLIVAQNAATMHSNTGGFIGPVGGSDVLTGARINFNTLSLQPSSTPVVKLNNVANQTGNTSYANVCSTSQSNSTFTQCPSPIHTTGSNISAWINTIEGETIATLTNCAAVGTGASPSVAACGAALAGHFSCAAAATGATCTINTTGVTANSTIIVQDSDTTNTGTLLSVTCNTSTTVDPTVRLLASQTAGTGFTINLGTVTTNPACFQYWIIN